MNGDAIAMRSSVGIVGVRDARGDRDLFADVTIGPSARRLLGEPQ
jgi:hypothetical protein